MSELKPVAYIGKHKVFGTEILDREKPCVGYEITPLYTKEQLQPRVKMTQKEFDEFNKLYKGRNHLIPIHFLKFISDNRSVYPLLNNLYWDGREKQLELLTVWLRFNPDKPEETIEIVPEKKWFVRSKTEILCQLLESEKQEYTHSYLIHNSVRRISYEPLFKYELEKAIKFDTKEQAEEWTNPLTEAVHLPVEEK